MTSVAHVDAVAAVLKARGGDVSLLEGGEAPTIQALLENLSLQDLVALAPLVPFDLSPVGCVVLLRWVLGVHPDALVLVLQAMPVAAQCSETGNPLAFALEPHLQGAVAGALRVLRDALPAPREWGLPLREDLVPCLLLLSEWSLRVGSQEHITLWREWLQAQARPGVALHSVLAVTSAHVDVEWALDTELALRVVVAAWGDRDMCAEDNAAEFAAFTTEALTLVREATLNDDGGGREGCVAPKPLTPSLVLWLKHALPRMAQLMTSPDAHSPSGVAVGPLWQQWLATMADSDAGTSLPEAWMHLCHMSMLVDSEVLRAMARVCAAAVPLAAPGGPLDAWAGDIMAHPLWWLHWLVSYDPASSRFGLALNLLWQFAQPGALALMMAHVISVVQWHPMHTHSPEAAHMVHHFVTELQRKPGGAPVWDALLVAAFGAGKPLDPRTLAFRFDEGDDGRVLTAPAPLL
jgi:hypothetical protein